MSADWSEGYFTDIGYTYGYYREISPVFLKFCLLLQGVAPPDATAPNYCELGIGQGLSLNIHAATNPGSYWGTDFNPEHAVFAQGLARAAGLTADIRDDSFEELLAADLPPMDYITLHGIWTWVSKENQGQIVRFARKFLKPGGVLYISYNCFPGWSPAAPLRQLFAMHDRYAGRAEGAMTRVQSAIDFSEKVLLNSDAAYTRQVPNLKAKLDSIKEQNKNYIAHEYFNREWNVMYFTDVADHLSDAKLDFAGSANPLDTVDAINLSAAGQKTLKEIAHPVLRQQVRDYLVGSQFRKDIFVRGARQLPARERNERLAGMRFVLTTNPPDIPRKVAGAYIEGNLQADVYDPVIAHLADRDFAPKTLRSLAAHMEGKATWPQVVQAVTMLIGMGHVAPCNDEEVAKRLGARADKLNQEIVARAVTSTEIAYMVSPVTGGAVPVSRILQLFLLAKLKKHADVVAFTWNVYNANNERMVKDGKLLEDEESCVAEIRRIHALYLSTSFPVLRTLGIA